MVIHLPEDKILKIRSKLNDFNRKCKVTLKELQSLLGLLNFATSCILPVLEKMNHGLHEIYPVYF